MSKYTELIITKVIKEDVESQVLQIPIKLICNE